jgi:hypothetical protein
LIFSTPNRSASSSKPEKTSFRICTVCTGESSSVMRVKPTMSANITVTSAWPWAMFTSPCLRRSAIAAGRMLRSSFSLLSFSRTIWLRASSTCAESLCFSLTKYHSSR